MANKTQGPKKIKVFSAAYTSLRHNNLLTENQVYLVQCNKGDLHQEFNSLDEASDSAAEHNKTHPGHKTMVTTTQES
jgi:hypothetical protein